MKTKNATENELNFKVSDLEKCNQALKVEKNNLTQKLSNLEWQIVILSQALAAEKNNLNLKLTELEKENVIFFLKNLTFKF